jgi:hypothetical protein
VAGIFRPEHARWLPIAEYWRVGDSGTHWKRIAQIASYLLQDEIVRVPERIDHFFRYLYEPKKNEPGREWPPSGRMPQGI